MQTTTMPTQQVKGSLSPDHQKLFVTTDHSKTTETPITVAVVDDEPVIRMGLESLLKRSSGFSCVGSYSDAESAMKEIPIKAPNVLLMDIQLPGVDGITAIRTLRGRLPNTEIIMLTALEDQERTFAAFTAGASGYLLKDTPPAKILEAIKEVYAGGSPLSSTIARRLVKFFGSEKAAALTSNHASNGKSDSGLTAREHEVLNCMAEGLLYKEAADRMGLSVDTIRAHLRNIYKKLGVRNRTEALLKLLDSKQD